MAQLNYRYVREGNVVVTAPYEQTDMSQLGGLTAIPINQKWQAIAAYYYDLQQSLNGDRLIGLRYDSCCWSLDLVLEQENKPDNVTLTASPGSRWFAIPDEGAGQCRFRHQLHPGYSTVALYASI